MSFLEASAIKSGEKSKERKTGKLLVLGILSQDKFNVKIKINKTKHNLNLKQTIP